MKIFITGYPGCGKTRLVKKISKLYKRNATGFYTEEIREKGKRVGFRIVDIQTGESEIFAHVEFKNGPQVSKYGVNLDALERIAIPALERKADLYIIDEIGKMEMFSKKFEEKINELLAENVNILATVHRDYKKKFENLGHLVELTRKNWQDAFEKISKWIL